MRKKYLTAIIEHLELILVLGCIKDRRTHRNQASMAEFVRRLFSKHVFLSKYSQFFSSKYHFEILTIFNDDNSKFRHEIEKSLTNST